MRSRLFRYFKDNVVAFLALFVALGGTGAYAANTVFSSDIVDGEVKSVDIANNSIHSGDVLDNTINTFDVHSFLGVDVVDNSLTGADINESTLVGVKDGDSCFQAGAQQADELCVGYGGLRTFASALSHCASFGVRLPDLGEAYLLAKNHDVPGVSNEDFWTSDTTVNFATGQTWVRTVIDDAASPRSDGDQSNELQTGTQHTVCVTSRD